jgi:hypothetical protein
MPKKQKKEARHVAELRRVIEENPEEAMRIAMHAVLGLVIVGRGDGCRVIGEDEEYGSACDYLEHVSEAIAATFNVHACIKRLQIESEAIIEKEYENS